MANDFYDFGTYSDEIIEPAPVEPVIQWFHRRNFVDSQGKAKGITVGWHSQVGRNEDFDQAARSAGLRQVCLKQHGELVCYWQLGSNSRNEDEWGSAAPFVLAKGCLSEQEMQSSKTYRSGIAYVWGERENGTRRKSVKFRGMLPELYEAPVVFTVGGQYLSNFLLAALGKDGHYRVLAANNQRLQAQGIKTRTPYWGFRLKLMPGEDVPAKGKAGSSEVTKIITDIPAQITGEFLASHHVGQYRELVQEEIRASAWSIEWSLRASEEDTETDEIAKNGNEKSEVSIYDLGDHPFDDMPSVGPDGDYTATPIEFRTPEKGKPAVKQASSNTISLEGIPGTANPGQRKALLKLGLAEMAQKAGLSHEQAKREIMDASAKRR